MEFELGRHYIVVTRYNGVNHANIDLEGWARDVGALKDYEALVE